MERVEDLNRLTVMLNDAMAEMDQSIVVTVKGKQVYSGVVKRTIGSLHATLEGRGDPYQVFDGAVTVALREEAK